MKKISLIFLVFVLAEFPCFGEVGNVDGAGGIDLKDAVMALQVTAGMTPDGIFKDADVNGDFRIGPEEAVFCLQAASGLRNMIKGTVSIPESVPFSNIIVTDFSTKAAIDESGAFAVRKAGMIMAADQTKNEIIYICYPSTDPNPQLNAKETAVSLILRILPFTLSGGDPNLDSLKQIIYSFAEVQALETAIVNTLNTKGFLDILSCKTEYETAIAAVADAFGLLSVNDLSAGRRSARSFSPTNSGYYGGVKIDIDDSIQSLGQGRYKTGMNVYNRTPLYLGLTLGVKTKEGGFTILRDSDFFLISPMDTSDFLDGFTTAGGIKSYFSDLCNIAFTDMTFAEGTWDSQETRVPAMEISCCFDQNVLVITGNSYKVQIARSAYIILSGIEAVSGTDIQSVIDYLIRDPDIVNQCTIYIQQKKYEQLILYVYDRMYAYIDETARDGLLSALSNKLWGIVSTTANGLDFVSASLYLGQERPDMAFDLPCDDKPPAVSDLQIASSDIVAGDSVRIQFRYCDPDGLDGNDTIYIRSQDDSHPPIELIFPADSSGIFDKTVPVTHEILGNNTKNAYDIEIFLQDDSGNRSTGVTQTILVNDKMSEAPTISDLEVPSQVNAGEGFNIRFRYDDPDGIADIYKFVIHPSDPDLVPCFFPNAADSSKQFDFINENGSPFTFGTPGVFFISVYAVDNSGMISTRVQQSVTVLNPANVDNDGDGYSENQNDCNDDEPGIYPGAVELCQDNIDQNCNNEVDEGCNPSIPGVPVNVSAQKGDGQIAISWNAVDAAIFYNVYQNETAGVSKTVYSIRHIAAGNSAVIKNLSNGTAYYFVVTAVGIKGESVESVEVSATPSASGGNTLTHRIPDTGQTKCYNASGTEIPCAGTGQDGEYTINPMSYTKLDAAGNDLPDSAESWAMVRDNVTGLIWEVKQNKDGVKDYGNPNDADNTYTWYDSNPETNGGVAGIAGNGTDTEDYLNTLRAKTGYSDWRLPTREELRSIVDYSIAYSSGKPTINKEYFPNTQMFYYWSSTTSPYYWTTTKTVNTSYAWAVDFRYGSDDTSHYKYSSLYVRAVRSGQVRSFDSLVISSDGKTFRDPQTGLMWEMKQNMDCTSVESDPNDADNTYSWTGALNCVAELNARNYAGYSDWRLPTIKELASLADMNRFPTIPSLLENTTESSYYLSSTTYAGITENIWMVNFLNGNGGVGRKFSGTNYARAVRSGQ
ncbi:MAG: DUF1566 domain-containing protein [Desulfococcaceae bacterium]